MTVNTPSSSYRLSQKGDVVTITFYSKPQRQGSVLCEITITLTDARNVHRDLGTLLSRAGS